jgi:MoaA/NifB/PqqE/SkfB family radical SAM enzyme
MNISFVKKLLHFILNKISTPVYQIELTSYCNAKCIFCSYPYFEQLEGSSHIDKIYFEKILKIIDKQKIKRVSLTPKIGEIFINADWSYYLDKLLTLKHVDVIHLTTNGILLNNKNILKLINMKNLHKVKIHISLGGTNKDEYIFLYGVDKFDNVVNNIQNLCKSLAENNLSIPLRVEIRSQDTSKIDNNRIQKLINSNNYKYITFGFLDTYDPLHGYSEAKKNNLKLIDIEKINKDYPCAFLRNITFNINKEVSACNVVSAKTDSINDLKLGTINDNFDKLLIKQQNIYNNWKSKKQVPNTCADCGLYS